MTRPVAALTASTVAVAVWTFIGVSFALYRQLPVSRYPVLLAILLAGVATGWVLSLMDDREPVQEAQRRIRRNYPGGSDYVEMRQAAQVEDEYDRFGPEGVTREQFRHYGQWMHAEQETPSMEDAWQEAGIDRDGYRTLFRWYVDAGWYVTRNRGKYDNGNQGDWTPEKGERALAALYAVGSPAAVVARYNRPHPGGVASASRALTSSSERATGENDDD